MDGLSLSPDDLAQLDANMIGCFRLLAMTSEAGATQDLDGITLAATGAATASFNVAFVTRPLANPTASLAAAGHWFRQRKLPFCVRLRSGLDPEAGRVCRQAGLTDVDTMPAMFLPSITTDVATTDAAGPHGLDILLADEPGAAADHAAVLAGGFGMSRSLAEILVAAPLLHDPAIELYVGYHAGEPVAASSLVVTGGVAGVYNVATLPRFRRLGYGEAMTRHAICRGAQLGCQVATLQATLQGRTIYERMGFRTVAHYLTYHRPNR